MGHLSECALRVTPPSLVVLDKWCTPRWNPRFAVTCLEPLERGGLTDPHTRPHKGVGPGGTGSLDFSSAFFKRYCRIRVASETVCSRCAVTLDTSRSQPREQSAACACDLESIVSPVKCVCALDFFLFFPCRAHRGNLAEARAGRDERPTRAGGAPLRLFGVYKHALLGSKSLPRMGLARAGICVLRSTHLEEPLFEFTVLIVQPTGQFRPQGRTANSPITTLDQSTVEGNELRASAQPQKRNTCSVGPTTNWSLAAIAPARHDHQHHRASETIQHFEPHLITALPLVKLACAKIHTTYGQVRGTLRTFVVCCML